MFIDLDVGPLHEPLSGRRATPAEARALARSRAAVLSAAGVERGSRVLLHFGNSIEFFVDLLALWALGACPVPLDGRLTAFEIERLLRALRPAASVWLDPPQPEVARAIEASRVPLIDAAATAAPRDFDPRLPRLDDPALLLLTSGTTGEPKAVLHTHRSLRSRWSLQRERIGVDAFDATLCLVPTQFAWGLVGHCLYAWLSGKTVLLAPAQRQDVLLRAGQMCDEFGVTCMATVPTMWRVLPRMAAPPRGGTLRLATCGTGPLTDELWASAARWTGTEVANIYGITETGWIAGSVAASGRVAAAGGLSPWGTVVRVLAGTGTAAPALSLRRCEPGEVGHVWVQSPSLMSGYFERDDLTDAVLAGGWFDTGDLGTLDAQGRLVLHGREREQINVGGAKVYPADVDAIVGTAGDVIDACTFAVSDPLLGQSVATAVVLGTAGDEALRRVYEHARTRLSGHQVPRRWYVVDAIARTARGKLDRRLVASQCEALVPVDDRRLARTDGRAER